MFGFVVYVFHIAHIVTFIVLKNIFMIHTGKYTSLF